MIEGIHTDLTRTKVDDYSREVQALLLENEALAVQRTPASAGTRPEDPSWYPSWAHLGHLAQLARLVRRALPGRGGKEVQAAGN